VDAPTAQIPFIKTTQEEKKIQTHKTEQQTNETTKRNVANNIE